MRDFLKYTVATFVGLLLFVTLGVSGLILLISAIASLTSSDRPAVQADSVLAFNLSLNITDSNPSADPDRLLGAVLTGERIPDTLSLRAVLDAIDRAAADDRITGLYLYGNTQAGGAGLASLREVRQALEAFQASGKPIFAYVVQGTERDYYLTSIADTLLLNPAGAIEINGFRSETPFFAGALQKYGIGVQILRVGRYKSAVEPFTRTSSSPEERQQTQKLLNDLWGEFLATTAESRDLTPQQMQSIADTQGVLLADQAVAAGLVDQVAYLDEAVAEVRKLTGEDRVEGSESFQQVSLSEYAGAIDQEQHSGNQIALVYAEGDIVDGTGSPGQIGGQQFAAQLRELRENEAVKAIVLRVNSPGGSATASDLVAREVQLSSQAKPVIVSMGNFAASGGYLIATYADRIFASPNTVTGSIGVFGLLPNVQQLANRNGITWDIVKTGRFADSQTVTRPKTPQELAIGQRIVDQIYSRFVSSVSESRSLPPAQVNEIAQGRVWSGIEAQKIGLVDQLGGLEDAIAAAAKQANLGEDWYVEEYPKTRSLEAQILGNLFGAQLAQWMRRDETRTSSDPLSIELQKLRADLETLQAMNDPLGAYTRLPFNLRVD
jgi:protease-4